MRPRRRVAVTVQRWGSGIEGGAEQHARSVVAVLRQHHDVTVLTSCARDARRWDAHYAPGRATEDGVPVKRFAHPLRNVGGRAQVPLRHKLRLLLRRAFDALGRDRVAAPRGDERLDGHLFLRRQGPATAGLLDELRQGATAYDAVVFMTALYFPTAEGLPLWGRRSVLIPTLHDEKPMYLPWFRRVFAAAGQILYNTDAERRLARRLYGADAGPGVVVGIPAPVAAVAAGDVDAAGRRHRLPARYLVYLGRIEKGKGCADLLAAWLALHGRVGAAALVFIGKGSLPIAESATVRVLGYLPADERDAVLAGAQALVMPSRFESLSAVLLEAMALGVPVLANAACEVLRDQVEQSAAGEAYRGRRQLQHGLLRALERGDAERRRLGEAGRRFVAARYRPEVVHGRWLDAVEQVCALPGAMAAVREPA